MRWLGVVLLAFAMAACDGDDAVCTSCVDARRDAAPSIDAEPVVPCVASGGCPSGQPCGATCCGPGERCDYDDTCVCGDTGAACGAGDSCEPFGPAACGSICCGVSGPCPQ
jgi:hypothetical protein